MKTDNQEDIYYEETEPSTHTYSNGAKTCTVDKVYTSRWEFPTKIRPDGGVVPVSVGIPLELKKERLIIGTDAKRSYVRLEVWIGKKHPQATFWEKEDVGRMYGISFSPKTMAKIAKVIEGFSR